MPDRLRVPPSAKEERVLLSSAGSSTTTAGALASSRWVQSLAVTPPAVWRAELELRTESSRFTIEVDHREWGYIFCHAGRSSWIRVTDVPFVHDKDDFALLERTPPLRDIGALVRYIEREYKLVFKRCHASVETDVPSLVPESLRWLASL